MLYTTRTILNLTKLYLVALKVLTLIASSPTFFSICGRLYTGCTVCTELLEDPLHLHTACKYCNAFDYFHCDEWARSIICSNFYKNLHSVFDPTKLCDKFQHTIVWSSYYILHTVSHNFKTVCTMHSIHIILCDKHSTCVLNII